MGQRGGGRNLVRSLELWEGCYCCGDCGENLVTFGGSASSCGSKETGFQYDLRIEARLLRALPQSLYRLYPCH